MAQLLVETPNGGPRPIYLKAEAGRRGPARRTLQLAVQLRNCSKANFDACPHGPYAYAVVPDGRGTRRVYLGTLDKDLIEVDVMPVIKKRRPAPRRRARRER